MRYSRILRFAGVIATVCLGLLVAADFVALQVAESRASAGFAQATAAERASVTLGGFPFVPRLIAGRVSRVDVRATGVSGSGMRVARLEASVQDVRFSAGDAVALIRSPHAQSAALRTGQAVARAEVAEDDLEAALRTRLAQLRDLRISPSGIEARLDLPDGSVSDPIRFLPRVENGRVILRRTGEPELPDSLAGAMRAAFDRALELPAIPQGLTIAATLGEGTLDLEASAPGLDLSVGEGTIRARVDPGKR